MRKRRAPFVQWLKQRTRWYKGWMQTWLVHMRRPDRLWRELSPAGAIAFQIFFAANVLAALIHPLFMIGLGYTLYALPTPWANAVMENAAPIFITSLCSGYASTIVLDLIGLRRRGLLGHAWVLVLTPLHWLSALARRLARAIPSYLRSAALGEDRARAGENIRAAAGWRGIRPRPSPEPDRCRGASDRRAISQVKTSD